MADLNKIVEDLSSLTVLEAAELSKLLEDKWGVSAAAPVAVAAAPAAGAGESAEEEKTEFDVVLAESGSNKIAVIKEVRTITGGRSQILPGGSLFVEEDNYGRLLFFNSDGSLRWEYINRGNNNVVSELGWSRLLYKDKDLKIVQNLLKKLYDG